MLEIGKKVIKVKHNETVYELKMCSANQAKELFKKMKAVDTEKDADQLIDLQEQMLRDCGAPEELLKDMSFDDFKTLSDLVIGIKKN